MRLEKIHKRERILYSAAHIFSSQKYSDVLIEDIAKKAKIGKGTVYLYFKNKDELYLETLLFGMLHLMNEVRKIIESEKDAHDKLQKIISKMWSFFRFKKPIFLLVNKEPHELRLAARQKWKLRREELIQLISRVIIQGQKEKIYKDFDALVLSEMVLGLVRGIVKTGKARENIDVLFEVLYKGIKKCGN